MYAIRSYYAHEGSLLVIDNVRKVSKSIPLLIDTKGPEVRTTEIGKEGLVVEEGDIIAIGPNLGDEKGFFTNYEGFVKDIPVGADILIDDGETAVITSYSIHYTKLYDIKRMNFPSIYLILEEQLLYFVVQYPLDISYNFV